MAASNAPLLPTAVVDATLNDELAAATAWAERYCIPWQWSAAERQFRLTLKQPETGEQFYLSGQFDDYRLLPPSWRWFDSNWVSADALVLSPKCERPQFGSSVFIAQSGRAVICAPFNRHAHKVYNGPHGDWGDPVNWATAGGGQIRATTIGDMLQAIRRDFVNSRGRLQ